MNEFSRPILLGVLFGLAHCNGRVDESADPAGRCTWTVSGPAQLVASYPEAIRDVVASEDAVYVAWREDESVIAAQHVGFDGAPVGARQSVLTDGEYTDVGLAAGFGHAAIVGTRRDGTTCVIRALGLDGTPLALEMTADVRPCGPIVATPTGFDLIVEDRTDGRVTAFGFESRDAAGKWGTGRTTWFEADVFDGPRLARFDDGSRLVVVRRAGATLVARRFDPAGLPASGEQHLRDVSGLAEWSAVPSNEGALVALTSSSSSWTLQVLALRADGSVAGDPIPVAASEKHLWSPSLARVPDGGALLGWIESDSSATVRVLSATGAPSGEVLDMTAAFEPLRFGKKLRVVSAGRRALVVIEAGLPGGIYAAPLECR